VDEATLKKVARLHSQEIVDQDPKQNQMSLVGTAHLVTIMNDYDFCPPTTSGMASIPSPKLGMEVYRALFDKGYDGCWMGCTLACSHGVKTLCPPPVPRRGKRSCGWAGVRDDRRVRLKPGHL